MNISAKIDGRPGKQAGEVMYRFQGVSQLPTWSGPALVMGAAPSLMRVDVKSFEGLKIGVGDVPVRIGSLDRVDYWVTANSYFPLPWIRRHRAAMRRASYENIVFATSAFSPLSPRKVQMVLNKLQSWPESRNLILYDQRHNDGPCVPVQGCCAASEIGVSDPPIQRQLKNLTTCTYVGGHSVIFHGIALALILGASPIYIAGVELPMRNVDYTYALPNAHIPQGTIVQFVKWQLNRAIGKLADRLRGNMEPPSMFAYGRDEIVSDLTALSSAAAAMGTELVCLSPNSLLNEIPGIRTDLTFLDSEEK